jgi:hypothetical protein
VASASKASNHQREGSASFPQRQVCAPHQNQPHHGAAPQWQVVKLGCDDPGNHAEQKQRIAGIAGQVAQGLQHGRSEQSQRLQAVLLVGGTLARCDCDPGQAQPVRQAPLLGQQDPGAQAGKLRFQLGGAHRLCRCGPGPATTPGAAPAAVSRLIHSPALATFFQTTSLRGSPRR